jgi:hypothetical protein
MVEESTYASSSPSNEQRLVQTPRSHKPIWQVCCVTTVEETAVYGRVRKVVWEDGGREAPSYPIVRRWLAAGPSASILVLGYRTDRRMRRGSTPVRVSERHWAAR